MNMPARQRGLTMTGFLFVSAVVLVLALLSFRVIPAYIEYEYRGADAIVEVKKCYQFMKDALA